MFQRLIKPLIKATAAQYPVVTITGPRQSGKTTLARTLFARRPYVSLENPDARSFALDDPLGFLAQFDRGAVLDEVQHVPPLFSYIQTMVDADPRPGRFILAGSQNFSLLEKVSQSLAGRTAIFHLLPLSQGELAGRKAIFLDDIGRKLPRRKPAGGDLFDTLFRGFYPRIHDKGLDPQVWLRNYYQTYVERDVRTLVNVGDIEGFGRFVRHCAARSGQLLNLVSLGNDCGISNDTAKRWLSVLEASFVVYLLRPYHKNFGKRLVKSPKLYFLDTGLLCYLLRIRSAEDLAIHSARGAVFETFVVSELLKAFYNQGRDPDIYFWRDSTGHEIDLLIDSGAELVPIEVKSGQTVAGDFFDSLNYWRRLPGQSGAPVSLVYGGDTTSKRRDGMVYSWRDWL